MVAHDISDVDELFHPISEGVQMLLMLLFGLHVVENFTYSLKVIEGCLLRTDFEIADVETSLVKLLQNVLLLGFLEIAAHAHAAILGVRQGGIHKDESIVHGGGCQLRDAPPKFRG